MDNPISERIKNKTYKRPFYNELTFRRLSDVPFQKYMRYSVWKLFICLK